MSAYIVDKNHIIYLVAAAMSHRIAGRMGPFRYVVTDETKPGQYRQEQLAGRDYDKAEEIANMLLRENIKSVSYRYPGESSATLPGPVEPYAITADDIRSIGAQFGTYCGFEPPQVFASLDCLCYQSCEHPEWEQSEAFAFVQALRSACWHALAGYLDAAWGAPEIVTHRKAA